MCHMSSLHTICQKDSKDKCRSSVSPLGKVALKVESNEI